MFRYGKISIFKFGIILLSNSILFLFSDFFLTHYRFRNPDDPVGGFLILGGSDPAYYEGEMHYVDLSATTYWQVSMKG